MWEGEKKKNGNCSLHVAAGTFENHANSSGGSLVLVCATDVMQEREKTSTAIHEVDHELHCLIKLDRSGHEMSYQEFLFFFD